MVHILWSNNTPRPWWRADHRWGVPGNERIWCDCCNAYSPAQETDVRLLCVELPIGDGGDYQNNGSSFFDLILCGDEPRWETRCADGFGCTIKPRRKASAHLRERV